MIIKRGNSKISRVCGVITMPTTVCPVQCRDCYAKKAERLYPNVLPSRLSHYNLFTQNRPAFIAQIIYEIKKANTPYFRIHESGDFFSQSYVDAWYQIMTALPSVKFYTYTKTTHLFNFPALKNFNLINSITPLGVNFGDDTHVQALQNIGYTLCPCTTPEGKNLVCMQDCTHCLTKKHICFKKH